MSEIIQLSKSNYKSYLPIDIIAFSFAEGGAMGEGGGIYIVDRNRQTYHLNLVRDEWEVDDVYTICPVLKDCHFDFFGDGAFPEGWTEYYMGFGNHLFLYDNAPSSIAVGLNSFSDSTDLYQNWHDIVLKGLQTK